MPFRQILPILAACLFAASCSEATQYSETSSNSDQLFMMADQAGAQETRTRGEPVPAEPGLSAPDTPVEQYIAYAYSYALEFAPNRAVDAMAAHRDLCLSAGPDVCQVVNASSSNQQGNRSRARLQIRAVPDWIADFRDGLEADVEAADGAINSFNMTASDLTRPILDAQARLEAKRALRERLTGLLDRPSADIEALIRLERELARVQGEIESGDANLRAMMARVSMSTLDLNYTTRHTPTGGGALDPIGYALSRFVRDFSTALGDVITVVASTAPWLIIIIPALWLVLRWRRRVAARKQAAKQG